MRHFGPTCTLAVACILFSVSYRDAALAFSSDAPSPPSAEFGELYGAVQMSGLFSDQKTFADAIPDKPPSQIVANYEKQKQLPRLRLESLRCPSLCHAEGAFRGLRAAPKSER